MSLKNVTKINKRNSKNKKIAKNTLDRCPVCENNLAKERLCIASGFRKCKFLSCATVRIEIWLNKAFQLFRQTLVATEPGLESSGGVMAGLYKKQKA